MKLQRFLERRFWRRLDRERAFQPPPELTEEQVLFAVARLAQRYQLAIETLQRMHPWEGQTEEQIASWLRGRGWSVTKL